MSRAHAVAVGLLFVVAYACSDSDHSECGRSASCTEAQGGEHPGGGDGDDASRGGDRGDLDPTSGGGGALAGTGGRNDAGKSGAGQPGASAGSPSTDGGVPGTSQAGGAGLADEGGGAGQGGEAGEPGQHCATVELLDNGDFDGSGSWIETSTSGYEMITDASDFAFTPPSPPNLVWLGGSASDTQDVAQFVNTPAGTVELTLSGSVFVATQDASGNNHDSAYAGLADDVAPVLVFDQWTPLDQNAGFAEFEISLPAESLGGKELTFHLACTLDALGNTNFFFDSLSLVARVCN